MGNCSYSMGNCSRLSVCTIAFYPQSAQGNNKEEMARRASLEFASATNNTHLAPTIHHRGLDHPGEGGPQQQQPPAAGQHAAGSAAAATTDPTSSASSASTASTSSSSSKSHPAPGGDPGKGAPIQTPPAGVGPGSAKKTPSNGRPSGSCKL